ncbi:nuclear transport factor 2 family protein [Nocardioides sp. AE5]|uniref:nuclear transport factor 2 family protein n=1 Tax=Nocardioides sp. AE5 TaxID=2962573 RepID=UPI0028820F51|nr:nuclear transport factor 2 family protein [Nocardioides sp. AE5]MDT0201655.1 nuclear transport factor 2 family protein [Nocardioides sp. AE5]
MATDASATPVEVVERYLEEIYHQGQVDLVREICADPVVRHDPGKQSSLTHEDQIARINADLPQWQPHFTSEVLAGDDEYAVLVWTARGRTAERLLSGIEVFRVVEGRITDVWNAPYASQPWH